jgi:predicted small lipoprotein YifL
MQRGAISVAARVRRAVAKGALSAVACALPLLLACGQKGALTLPKPLPAASAAQ